jgi:hypothetical protein
MSRDPCLWRNDKEIKEATSVLYSKTELSKFNKPQLIQMLIDRQNEVKHNFGQVVRTWDTPVSDFEYELKKELEEWKELAKSRWKDVNSQYYLIKELKKFVEELKEENATLKK